MGGQSEIARWQRRLPNEHFVWYPHVSIADQGAMWEIEASCRHGSAPARLFLDTASVVRAHKHVRIADICRTLYLSCAPCYQYLTGHEAQDDQNHWATRMTS
jgi:hypothetical protein